MGDFDKAFEDVVGVEGGYVNNPDDPGGETNWGITAKTLQTAIDAGIVPQGTTVKDLTQDQAKAIYRAFYWDKVKGDQLPEILAVFAFDSAVNQGVTESIMLLQKTLGVAQDGILGVVTMAALQKSSKEQHALYMADRALRYFGTRNFDKFGRGWLKRLFLIAMEA